MKTYEIIQLVEMTVKHTVRADNADMANDEATKRTEAVCGVLSKRNKSITFGDIMDDYVPAHDDETTEPV